jgi:hypothetical protein
MTEYRLTGADIAGRLTAQRKAALDTARTNFANSIRGIVSTIQASGMLGSTFDWANYPSRDEILDSFAWEYKITALPTAKSLEGLPIDAALADALEADWEKTAKGQARFAQQRLAEDALKFVKNLAERTRELAEWAALPDDKRGRKPATHETLTTNVHEACTRMRTFAIPDTQEGAALLRLADDIENNLDVDRITAEDLKENMWVNPLEIPGNGVDDDGKSLVDDVHGADFFDEDGDPFDDNLHGTHCAGQKEKTKGNEAQAASARVYGAEVEAELRNNCDTILALLDSNLIIKSSTGESKVFYQKMKASTLSKLPMCIPQVKAKSLREKHLPVGVVTKLFWQPSVTFPLKAAHLL